MRRIMMINSRSAFEGYLKDFMIKPLPLFPSQRYCKSIHDRRQKGYSRIRPFPKEDARGRDLAGMNVRASLDLSVQLATFRHLRRCRDSVRTERRDELFWSVLSGRAQHDMIHWEFRHWRVVWGIINTRVVKARGLRFIKHIHGSLDSCFWVQKRDADLIRQTLMETLNLLFLTTWEWI